MIKLKILDIFNSEDKDIKKIVSNKTTLEIVLLIFKSSIEKKTLYADKFLDLNTIKASRSKKNIIEVIMIPNDMAVKNLLLFLPQKSHSIS